MLRIWPQRGRASTAAAENRCLVWLIEDLKSRGSDIPKGERRQYAIENFGVSGQGFDHRIWPTAIEQAGIKEKASHAGRKKNRVR
jgi:hypothetical protein